MCHPSWLLVSADLCDDASLRINQAYQSGRCLFTCYKHPQRDRMGGWMVVGSCRLFTETEPLALFTLSSCGSRVRSAIGRLTC